MTDNTELLPAAAPQNAVQAAPRATGSTPADLIRYAMESGADLDRLERLMDMQDKWERREAEKAYADAMAAFKLNPPTIVKNKGASFKGKEKEGRAGVQVSYDYADVGHVTSTIIPALAAHGFSHRWTVQQSGGKIIVTCTITHRMGHSESVTLEAAPDKSGTKNDIQAVGSAQSYLSRYTLLAACGLAVEGADDDGASVGAAAVPDVKPGQAGYQKHHISGPHFDKALDAIKAGKYSAADCRDYYALTPEQNAALDKLTKELAQ